MIAESRRAQLIARSHELLALASSGNALQTAIARAIAIPFGSQARGAFFTASKDHISPVGVDAEGLSVVRSTPSALDLVAYAVGSAGDGFSPYGYMRGAWVTLQCRAGDALVGGIVIDVPGRSIKELETLRVDCGGIAAHAAAHVQSRLALAEAQRLAATDALTGAASRAWFMRALAQASESREPHLLFLVDLDGLKTVNDTKGHAAGDRMIIDAVRALTKTVRVDEVVGRIGGDEFTVLVRASPDEAASIAVRLKTALGDAGIEASIGSCPVSSDIDADLASADSAMYQQKTASKRARLVALDGGVR